MQAGEAEQPARPEAVRDAFLELLLALLLHAALALAAPDPASWSLSRPSASHLL